MKKMTSTPLRAEFEPLFVCGAPRSGTTLLLSLICTSALVNPLSPECDYFTAFVHPYIIGRNRFELHTGQFFASMEDFECYHANILRRILSDMWNILERPAKLALKDVYITRYPNIVLKLLPEARMVISIRDPKDVVASRVAIEMRRTGRHNPQDIKFDFIDQVCQEYNLLYEYVLQLDGDLLRRVKLVRYERLVEMLDIPDLVEFTGLGDMDVNSPWKSLAVPINGRKSHCEWFSPLYGQKISNESVGNHHKFLDAPLAAHVETSCSTTWNGLLAMGGWHE